MNNESREAVDSALNWDAISELLFQGFGKGRAINYAGIFMREKYFLNFVYSL